MLSTAAIVAAGVALVPGVADAAGQAGATEGNGPGVAVPDLDLNTTEAYRSETSSSPASKTVHPAAKGGAKAADAAPAADPTVGLEATTTSAHGVELKLFVSSDPGTALGVRVEWGDGSQVQVGANGPTELTEHHTYTKAGVYTVKVSLIDGGDGSVRGTNQTVIRTAGNEFTPHAPTRLLDTRDGTGAARAKVPAFGTARVRVGGAAQIPADATAVVLNVTVTNPARAGHVRVYADGGALPTTSNVNYAPGQTVPNMVIASVGANGFVNIYNSGDGAIDLVADVTGYFSKSAASGYTSLTPSRVVDTREGLGTGRGQVPGQSSFSTQIHGRGGVPASAKAVALNVTVTEPKNDGHLTVYPSGGSAPTASNVNFTTGQTIANSVIVPIGADGRISIRNGAWAGTHVVVDVVGYYSPESGAALIRSTPSRWFDTREWDGPLDGRSYIYGEVMNGDPNVTALITNATVTNTVGTGFLTVSPDPNSWEAYEGNWASEPTPPNSSNLNWTPGKTVPNLVQASSGPYNVIDFWNMGWQPTDLVVDTFGFYAKN
ncbi:PKD domain-containing protein [Streptomyces sp. NRRL F-2664]|uniref:PKD domain-containing protein n=1 Tax=Streptomyces sp. NRRL F-2664 TaxID=1463842 RepID=UPI0005B7D538|nr:PKD domain-containing protein [Streptomyces sp. NRRL F-2664]